jgi:hypothetical protein
MRQSEIYHETISTYKMLTKFAEWLWSADIRLENGAPHHFHWHVSLLPIQWAISTENNAM